MTPDHGAMPPKRTVGNDGPNPALVAALKAHADGVGGPADVHSALAASRLLIPVVEPGAGKGAHLSSVTITDDDGVTAMLAFTSESALLRWDSRARPVPVPTRSTAEAALANGAGSLVIDIAGPVRFTVDAPGLRSLASGWREHGLWPAAGESPASDEGDDDVSDGVDDEASDGVDDEASDGAATVTSSEDGRATHVVDVVRDLVVRRVVPTTMAVATRVWSAVRRVSRTGTR